MIKCGVCPTVSGPNSLIVAKFGSREQGFVKYYRCTAHQHVEPTVEELSRVDGKEATYHA